MKIGYIAFAQTPDIKAWSGTVYMIYQSLKKINAETEYICCSPHLTFMQLLVPRFFNLLNRLHITKKRFVYSNSFMYRKQIAKKLETLDLNSYDLLFVAGYSVIVSAIPQSYKHDIIYLADSAYSGLENYYPEIRNLYSFSSKQANALSKDAFERSTVAITASDWAKNHAVKDYGISPDKIEVIEFGANLDCEVMGKLGKRDYNKPHFNVLLCGVSWERKGGDVAVQCCKSLIEKGLDVTLGIAGMDVPERYKGLSFIKEYGFLNKNIPEQREKYLSILADTDIHIFPTKAEAAGIVTCEAAGFGIPTFSYDTGGVGNYVVNDVNGYRLNVDATGEDFADCIYQLMKEGKLEKLSLGATQIYNSKLNWQAWSNRVHSLLEKIGQNSRK